MGPTGSVIAVAVFLVVNSISFIKDKDNKFIGTDFLTGLSHNCFFSYFYYIMCGSSFDCFTHAALLSIINVAFMNRQSFCFTIQDIHSTYRTGHYNDDWGRLESKPPDLALALAESVLAEQGGDVFFFTVTVVTGRLVKTFSNIIYAHVSTSHLLTDPTQSIPVCCAST
jgi:hypothetical protein